MSEKESINDIVSDYLETYPNETENTISLCIESLVSNEGLTKDYIKTPILNLLALQKLIKKLHQLKES